jgi:hypothetical protein
MIKESEMEQLELFVEEGPQHVRKWLHVWTEAERANKKAPAQSRGESLPKQGGGAVESEGHQAASKVRAGR